MDSIDKELNYLASKKAWLDVDSKGKGDSYEDSLIKEYDWRVKKTKAFIAFCTFFTVLVFMVGYFLPADTLMYRFVSSCMLVSSCISLVATAIYAVYCSSNDKLESLDSIAKGIRYNLWHELVFIRNYLLSEDPKYRGQQILSLPKPHDQLYTERKDILDIYMLGNDKKLYLTSITLHEGKKILEEEVQYQARKVIRKRIISDGLL